MEKTIITLYQHKQTLYISFEVHPPIHKNSRYIKNRLIFSQTPVLSGHDDSLHGLVAWSGIRINHYITWPSWCLKSPTTPLFPQLLSRRISKKISKLRATGFCEGNPPMTEWTLCVGHHFVPSEFHRDKAGTCRFIWIIYSFRTALI